MIKRPLCTAAVLFLCIQAVLTVGFQISSDLKSDDFEKNLDYKSDVILTGTVCRREEKPDYNILYLKDNRVLLKKRIYQESKILVYIETTNHIAIGNKIKVTGEAEAFQIPRNPGNFNQKFYYQKQGIHASVWAQSAEVQDGHIDQLRENLAVLRAVWKKKLTDCLGDYYGNSMSAILLGDKSELDSELKDLYQKSGIGHILAISGLHMSFLGIGLYKMLRKIGLNFGISGGIGICFLLAYTLMIGSGVSSMRALVMFIVRMGADITGRDYDMPTSLALAAAVITVWQPLYLLDAGFLLSFGALLGITAVNPCLEACFLRKRKQKAFVKSICASLSINLVLLPVMLYYYFEFPTYSIILNLLVIPLMSLLLGAGAIGSIILTVLPQAGGAVLQLCKWTLVLYEKACEASLGLPVSRIVTGQPGKGGIVCYYIVLLSFCLLIYYLRYREETRNGAGLEKDHTCVPEQAALRVAWPKTALGGITIFILCLTLYMDCTLNYGRKGELTVTMMDVGQGDGLYLKGPDGMTYFIDGGSSDVSSVGRYRIEPFLKSQGVQSLDYVFISHGDADHMNGIEEMLDHQEQGISIRNLVLPPERVQDETLMKLTRKAESSGTRVVVMTNGEQLSESGLKLICKGPAEAYQGEPGNAASMILEVSYGAFDMLLTGDVEGEGEKLLEQSGALKQYDVLKAAHHGSKNSTSEAFLKLTEPKIAWISSGLHNQYGHPHEETIRKLSETGSRIYGTQEYGAVTLTTDGKKFRIDTYLLED